MSTPQKFDHRARMSWLLKGSLLLLPQSAMRVAIAFAALADDEGRLVLDPEEFGRLTGVPPKYVLANHGPMLTNGMLQPQMPIAGQRPNPLALEAVWREEEG